MTEKTEILMDKFKEIFLTTVDRENGDKLLDWLDNQTDFFLAPASTRYHECYEGGLVEHSITVYYALLDLVSSCYSHLFEEINSPSIESMAIVSLLHDVCKCNMYEVEMRNKKIDGQWWEVPCYTVNEKFKMGGHGSKSLYLIQNHISLTMEEATAINCHMGVEHGKWEVLSAFRQFPLAFLLHTADMLSTIPELKALVLVRHGINPDTWIEIRT